MAGSRFALAALLLGLVVVDAAGCTCEMPPDPTCSYGSCAGTDQGVVQNYPHGAIDHRYDSITISPGAAVDFKGKVYCPPKARPCTFRWDFGNGQTSTAQSPGQVPYSTPGFYLVSFTVTDASGLVDPLPSRVRVTVWNGEFKDTFDRKEMEYDKYGWRRPLYDGQDPFPLFSIEGGYLKEQGNWGRPGSTALMAWPLVQDARIELVKRRAPRENPVIQGHFSDIIVRMHPSAGVGSFYRIRFWEDGGTTDGIEIAMFKITDPNDEHGILFNDPAQPTSTRPTACVQCPYLGNYPRDKDIRLVVEMKGRNIQSRMEDPSTGKVLISSMGVDDMEPPLLYDGLVGITHFNGVSLYKPFIIRKLSDLTRWDGPAPDAGGPTPPPDAASVH